MPLIGVRISWLMLARNSLLARLAVSAWWLASRNSASTRFCRVMSVITPRMPPTSPCPPVKSVLLRITSRTSPLGWTTCAS